jgi:hypothetical protein
MSDAHGNLPPSAPARTRLPFGLQYAETCRTRQTSPPLTYDETRDLTVTMLPGGDAVPYVALASAGETQTFTKVTTESTDADPQHLAPTGTQTFTKVRTEQVDPDVSSPNPPRLGTSTMTLVASETSDADPSAMRTPPSTHDPDVAWLGARRP